ncbi:hypothetical protein KP509_25G047000 [Ceratopteris richardii]|nr:hypothetical protein KP509_25G047000 [Ceratopteris richardii]KAH7298504.1 hypothetical protein KP509_25G047000 [Ceratopteris richardii]
MGDRTNGMWCFTISLCCEGLRSKEEGVQFFWHSLLCNALPDASNLMILLSCCRGKEALAQGKRLHVLAKSTAWDSQLAVGTALLSMYNRCGSLQESRVSFDKLLEKSVVSWNAMITACVQHNYEEEAIQLFICMQNEGFLPNKITYIIAASACAGGLDILTGKSLYLQALSRGVQSDVAVASAFVNMYSKFGFIESAGRVFHDVEVPCVVLWTGMLTVYCQHRYTKEAISIYCQMKEIGILPNAVTFLCLISTCDEDELLSIGKQTHAQVMACGFQSNIIISTALAVMYSKFGLMEESQELFSSIAEKSTLSWNAWILSSVNSGQSNRGMQLFSDMLHQGLCPDKYTFVNVLHACSCLRSVFNGKIIHQHLLQTELSLDTVVCNALIDMYGNFMLLSLAQSIFDRMHNKNIITWNTLITSYARSNDNINALIIFRQMQGEGMYPNAITFASILTPLAQRNCLYDCWRMHNQIIYKGFDLDPVVATNMITAYGMNEALNSAHIVFDKVTERDDGIWCAYISMLCQNDVPGVLWVLDNMRNQGSIPSRTILLGCVSSCLNLSLRKISHLHVGILHLTAECNETELSALISKYAEYGDLSQAWSLFNEGSCTPISWNSMIGALAGHGQAIQAFKVFVDMKLLGIMANETTFLHLFSACNHAGLVDDAFRLLILMGFVSDRPVAACHHQCILDLLGRAGQLNIALLLANTMPFKPSVVTWTSFLGSCTNMSDVALGEGAANYLFEVSSDDFVPYILLARMYSEISAFAA